MAEKTVQKQKSAKKNYFYNLVYQFLLLIAPLITTPYISRVIGVSGVGQYSFTYSITSYFVLLASLGFGFYAQREIARHDSSKKNQSILFWEIMICKFLSMGLALCIDLALIFAGVYQEYTLLMKLLLINIVSTFFDVSFFFQGREEFGLLALVNSIAKILGVVCIFVFVKSENDLWLYAIFQSAIMALPYFVLFFFLPKRLEKVSLSELHFTRHLVPTLRLFVPTIAASIYTMLDRTLIGLMVTGEKTIIGEDGVEIVKKISDLENGYYEQAEKIVKMAMTVITSLGTVMIPRNSKEIASGHVDKFIENIYKSLRFAFFLGVPIFLGLLAVANNFCPWFFGEGYEKVPALMMIFSPIVLIIGLSNVLGLQCLIPEKQDGKFTIAITCGAIINLCLNLIFIPFYQSFGAAIASVIAESIVTATMFVFVRKQISFVKAIKTSWKYFVAGSVMFIAVFTTQHFLTPSLLYTCLLVLEGVAIYALMLLLLKDSAFLSIGKNILSRLKRKKQNKEN